MKVFCVRRVASVTLFLKDTYCKHQLPKKPMHRTNHTKASDKASCDLPIQVA